MQMKGQNLNVGLKMSVKKSRQIRKMRKKIVMKYSVHAGELVKK